MHDAHMTFNVLSLLNAAAAINVREPLHAAAKCHV